MMIFSCIILKYWERGNKFTKSQEKIIHLMYMEDRKLFVKNKNNTWRLRYQKIFCQGWEFYLEKSAMI